MDKPQPPFHNDQRIPTTVQQAFNLLLAISRRGITLDIVNRENNRIKYRITDTNTRESFIAEMPENAQQTPQSNIILPTGHRS